MEGVYWAALGLGVTTSLHCLGMCGPLALALPVGEANPFIGRALYNGGRIVTYATFGAAMGAIGQSVSFFGYQQWLSIACGVSLLVVYLMIYRVRLHKPEFRFPWAERVRRTLVESFRRPPTYRRLFIIGLLNGALPCGAVYAALAAAVGTGSVAGGAGFMALFGAGTFPLMFALSLGKNWTFGKKLQNGVYLRYATLVVAALFILRGLNLGVPYLSPQLAVSEGQAPKVHRCH